MSMLTLIGAAILSGLFTRSLLIVLGWYKDPILRQFEQYGEEELMHSPLLALLMWAALLFVFALVMFFGMMYLLLPVFVLSIPIVYLYPSLKGWVRQHPQIFMAYPRWYGHLVRMTEREERRRLAYLWLRLPLRTRVVYNASDEYFAQWRDLVLMTMAH